MVEISNPTLPPREEYVEVEIDGMRQYREVPKKIIPLELQQKLLVEELKAKNIELEANLAQAYDAILALFERQDGGSIT